MTGRIKLSLHSAAAAGTFGALGLRLYAGDDLNVDYRAPDQHHRARGAFYG